MTTPDHPSSGPDDPPEGGVLGSAKATPSSGAAGPTWPPAETEPDAHRRRGSALRGLLDRLRPGRRG
jgi:hypothetical protein